MALIKPLVVLSFTLVTLMLIGLWFIYTTVQKNNKKIEKRLYLLESHSFNKPQMSQVLVTQDSSIVKDALKTIARLETSLQRMSQQMAELSCNVQSSSGAMQVTMTGGFCLDPNKVITGGNELFDGFMCAGIESLVGKSTIGDFGAGLGHYGRCFLRMYYGVIDTSNTDEQEKLLETYQDQMGASGLINKPQVVQSWTGYDGAGNIEVISRGFITHLDLTQEVDLKKRFNWVISLEVGEHIPRQYQNNYINNLITHACDGIIITWAIPSQSGYHHVNNLPRDTVIEEFTKRGLVHDLDKENVLTGTAKFAYFKRAMVFTIPYKTDC